MYTAEIVKFFEDKGLSRVVQVVASDCLPKKMKNNTALVINLSPSTDSGSHWIAIYRDALANLSYFCSFGTRSNVPSIDKFIRLNCKSIRFSDKCLQALQAKTCGEYVCVFLAHVLLYDADMNGFLKMFSQNPILNDLLIEKMFVRLSSFRN